ncbi:class I SAM-dependent methyltransferase [Microseira sp. BLCC-F43]|uniref:class I SAM-dependent methyltransferase n=1 Tax=Microseira sp. BLCC-F43 TaxID=3153602 RepID=UPI0035B936E2
METTLETLKTNPIIQNFIQDRVKFPHKFPTAIHPDDEMYLFSLKNLNGDKQAACIRYYSLGQRIFDAVKQIVEWQFQNFDNNVSSFLDFACGYGRFSRYLLQELSPQQIWVSDISANAVKFQTEQFNVNGIVSTNYPKDYPGEGKFDCILAASFFSHVPKNTFADWVEKLYSLLSPQGILIFSVHDLTLLPADVAQKSEGFYFVPESENTTLDRQLYGTTYVSEAFVSQVLAEKLGAAVTYYRIEKGLCRHQDIYIAVKHPVQEFSSLNFSHHPEGGLETCQITTDGKIYLAGWALDFNRDSKVEQIQIIVNGKLVQSCIPDCDRNKTTDLRSGWTCYSETDTIRPDDVLIVKAINSRELERVLAANKLAAMFC